LRVTLVINIASGRGRAVRIAERIEAALADRGHHTQRVSVQDSHRRSAALAESDVAVVVGGDGTLHGVLDDCLASQTPVYHAPAGTENLFAREFKMTPDPDSVCRAIEEGPTRSVDVWRANGRAFVLMASIGLDASVIHYLQCRRAGSITHLSYVKPILARLIRFPRAWFDVEADGRKLVERDQGLLIVANCRQYAARLDPARDAKPDDGLVDIVFLPFRTQAGLMMWSSLVMVGAQRSNHGFVAARAREVTIAARGPAACLQLDGEAVGNSAPGDEELRLSIAMDSRPLLVRTGPSH
jgi:diacylglycerol kinase family enzyme